MPCFTLGPLSLRLSPLTRLRNPCQGCQWFHLAKSYGHFFILIMQDTSVAFCRCSLPPMGSTLFPCMGDSVLPLFSFYSMGLAPQFSLLAPLSDKRFWVCSRAQLLGCFLFYLLSLSLVDSVQSHGFNFHLFLDGSRICNFSAFLLSSRLKIQTLSSTSPLDV